MCTVAERQQEALELGEGVGGEHAARGCRAEALVLVAACRRVAEWQGLPQLSPGECCAGCFAGELFLWLRKMRGGREKCFAPGCTQVCGAFMGRSCQCCGSWLTSLGGHSP